MKKRYIFIIAICAILSLLVSCDGSVNEMLFGGDDTTTIKPLSKPGDTIVLGKKADGTKITWKALSVDTENKRALLICEDILETRAFDDSSNEYANSAIRNYLKTTTGDGNFFNTYGLSTSYMKRVTISGEQTTVDDANGTDYLFLLSKTEAGGESGKTGYFDYNDDSSRIAQFNGQNTDWWLRTLYGTDGKYLYIVDNDGDVVKDAKFGISGPIGVRPAFWYAWAETEYKITYTIGDGASAATGNPASYIRYENTSKNESVEITKAPTRSGYTFKGWKLAGADDTTATTSYTISTDTTGDIELVAVWEEKHILSKGDAITSTDDSISIGRSKDGTEIIWKVLKINASDNRALLISQDVLETRAFNVADTNSYSGSDIQKYLNDTSTSQGFFKTYNLPDDYINYMDKVVFSGETTTIDNTATNGDFVFLLSETEAGTGKDAYFTTESSRMAKLLGTSTTTAWWLRTSDNTHNYYFKYVDSDKGKINEKTCSNHFGLRPAFWYKWGMN